MEPPVSKLKQMDLIKLMDHFHSDDKCRDILTELRWPTGVACIRCGSLYIRNNPSRNQFDCADCGYQFSVTAGTMMRDSHLPLKRWFLAVYLMTESKKGISALQLKRTLQVAYRTAWYLSHRIRAAMYDAYPMPLKGKVEIDETVIGGKVRGKGRGYKKNKAVVVGAVERNGKIVLKVVDARDRDTLHGFINQVTADETDYYFTDDWAAYDGIADDDTIHETVNHSAEEWVRGEVHTNSVENIWSLLKQSIIGAYHHVSVKHLDACLDELEWRYNNRDNPYLFRDTLLRLLGTKPVKYRELVAA